ncbi:hypothetical protein [Streptomyces sp. NPDC014676]|uniref:hypothetical protein n=1 Tax=Streptomyces sp. NPDC014676 TaxID=3364879 RepID=UPI0036F5D7A9
MAVLPEGPTEAERVKRLTTPLPLPLPGLLATPVPAATATDGPVAVPQEEVRTADLVKVVAEDDRVSIELTADSNELTGLPVDQLVCTALGRSASPNPGRNPCR